MQEAYLGGELSNTALNADDVEALDVAQHRGNQTLGSRHGDADVDVVTVGDDLLISVDGGVELGDLLGSQAGGLGEGTHVSQPDAVALHDVLLVARTPLHEGGHVNLVDGGQGSGHVLGLLELGGDGLAHARHLLNTLAAGEEAGGAEGGSLGSWSRLGGLLLLLRSGSGLALLLLGSLGLLLLLLGGSGSGLRGLGRLASFGLGLLLLGRRLLALRGGAGLDARKLLPNLDGVALSDEQLDDGSLLRGVDGNVNLVGLDASDLLIDLDTVTDLL